MNHAPSPKTQQTLVIRTFVILQIVQAIVIGFLVYYVTGEKGRTSEAVQRNNEGNCRLYQSFLPRDPSEDPTTAYGKRIVESVTQGLEFYHCEKFFTTPTSFGGPK